MILDSLTNAARYEAILPGLAQAFAFLRVKAKPHLAECRIEIVGDRMYALVAKYTTRDFESAQPEAHRRYVDVQYLVSGAETMYWTPLTETAPVTVPYDPQRDLMFFGRNSRARAFVLQAGDFAVFFPEDGHEPN